MLKMVEAVIFDMDGLMFDTETVYYRANQQAADQLKLPFDYTIYEKFIGASDEDFFNGMYELYDHREKVNQFIELSQQILRHSMTHDDIGIKKGLPELLEYLKAEGIQRMVASSSEREIVELLLHRTRTAPYIQEIVGGDEVAKAKPHPEIFLKAWKKTNRSKEHVWILEDSLNGVKAAHAASISCIMVPDLIQPTKEISQKTEAIMDDLTEVLDFFKKKQK